MDRHVITQFHEEFVEHWVNHIYHIFEIEIQQHIHHILSDPNQTFRVSNKANLKLCVLFIS